MCFWGWNNMDSFYDSLVDASFAGQYYRWKLERYLFSGEVYFLGARETRSEDYDALLVNPEGSMSQESLHVKFVSLKTIKQRVRDANRRETPPGVLNSIIRKAYKNISDDILFIGVSLPDGSTDKSILSFVRGMEEACLISKEEEAEYNENHNLTE